MFSIVTTCKNRLIHLQRSLPGFLKQTNSEVIVVDYGCEEGTAEWVREHYPAAKVVEVTDDPVFCAARARNIGARHASGPLLVFIDADTQLVENLADWIHSPPVERLFFAPHRGRWEYGGFIICRREDFDLVGGFDEAFRGWGHEDTDFIERLEQSGARAAPMPDTIVRALSHGNELRQVGPGSGGFSSLEHAYYLGLFYRRIKADVSRLNGVAIPLEKRIELMMLIKSSYCAAERQNQKELVILCEIDRIRFGYKTVDVERQLTYRLPIHHLLERNP
jgi:glycosyltransferase involved in cell wall biosynthesis